MWEKHPHLKEPKSQQRIWRYLDLAKLLSMLEYRALYLRRVDLLGDPYEGYTPARRFECSEEGPTPEVVAAMNESARDYQISVKSQRQLIYINCWHMNDTESIAMWKQYLKSNEGVAIVSTYRRLRECFNSATQRVHIGKVQYINHDKHQIPVGNIFHPFMRKRQSFAHEREIRVIYWNTEGVKQVDTPGFQPAAGESVPVNLDRLIESMFVAPTSGGWFRDIVEAVLKKYDLPRTVHQSSLDLSPVW
jgi:hypothetical protein